MQQKDTGSAIMNEADNGLKNRRGTIAMARTAVPHSATSQFFINTVDNSMLDFTGRTSRGGILRLRQSDQRHGCGGCQENQLTIVKPPHRDVPKTPVVIKKAVLLGAPKIK
ncbi:MAG: peptidylprolyl isomerase [Desulfobacterales bacterium]